MKQALILFTRIPVPGKTKTRLMPYFSPKQCAKLHTCFLKDISDQCRKVKADCFVCYAPENGDVKELQDILGKQKEYFPRQESPWAEDVSQSGICSGAGI